MGAWLSHQIKGYFLDEFAFAVLLVRKILGAREQLDKLQNGREWMDWDKFPIKKLYRAFMGMHKRSYGLK